MLFFQVAIVEIEIEPAVPIGLLVPFAFVSALLIFVHLLSLMLAICLLPELEALGDKPHPVLYSYAIVISKSFSVQFCWVLSNIVGILLFLVELVLVAFIKFYPIDEGRSENIYAALCTLLTIVILSVLMIPVLVYYSRGLAKYKIQLHERQLIQAQEIIQGINQRNAPLSFTEISSMNSATDLPLQSGYSD